MKSHSYTAVTVIARVFRVVLIILLLVVALAVYVMRMLDPLHYGIVALLVYIAYRNTKKLFHGVVAKKTMRTTVVATSRFTRTHKAIIAGVCCFGFLWYALHSVVPTDKDVFSSLSEEKQTEMVDDDVERAAVLMDMLVLSGNTVLENPSLKKQELTQEEGEKLRNDWENLILTSIETEKMTDRHRYFQQISMFSNKETHIKSFVIAYALYMKKFEIFHKIITEANKNPAAVKIFNQYSERLAVGGMYDDVTGRFFASNSLLRRNLGYAYFSLRLPKDSDAISPNYASLIEVSKASYGYLFQNSLSHVTDRSIVYKNTIDKTAFEAWLPIQKNIITDKVGNIHVGDRHDKFISIEQIQEMKKSLQPGDIILYRKNWYASNVGIPGFWTHAGLYTGTLEDMNLFFKDEIASRGYQSMNELLQKERPEVYPVLIEKDKKGYIPSVIESQTHGTLIQSVESSASVDYLGIVRSTLSKSEILEALLESFSHYNKPYDYAFDLDTKNEIYCSELVYDAYLATGKSKGIVFPKSMVSGRLMVPPSAIIEKFVNEHETQNSELKFVYFLDASETTKQAFVSDVKAFIGTLSRPKYSGLQE